MLRFKITPLQTGARGVSYRVDFNDQILIDKTLKPSFDACRALVEVGHTGPAEMWGWDQHLMTFRDIEKAALLTVSEGEMHGPRIVKYTPFNKDAFA
jgi:hypothetical protein